MNKVNTGDVVYVPAAKLGSEDRSSDLLVKCKVVAAPPPGKRKATVETLQGTVRIRTVATRHILLHAPEVLILRIGDFNTELSLLDRLAKSVLQFFRLLLPDDDRVTSYRLRSFAEFAEIWSKRRLLTNYVVLISHGRKDALKFGVDGFVEAEKIASHFDQHPPANPLTVLSLACHTGWAAFAKPLSMCEHVDLLIAPFHSVQGAIASHFLQSFFAHHFVAGDSKWLSFKAARASTPDGTHFRCWAAGEQQ